MKGAAQEGHAPCNRAPAGKSADRLIGHGFKNALGNFANSLVLNILKFVSRIIFVKVLSDVYLGVNGLLSNVLGILALAELELQTKNTKEARRLVGLIEEEQSNFYFNLLFQIMEEKPNKPQEAQLLLTLKNKRVLVLF